MSGYDTEVSKYYFNVPSEVTADHGKDVDHERCEHIRGPLHGPPTAPKEE